MINGPTRMEMLQTFVVIILFISETFCFRVDERNSVATLTDTDQDSKEGHDGKLVDGPGKTGYYDTAPKITKIDDTHEVVKRDVHTAYIKNGEPHDITALVYTDVTFECEPNAGIASYLTWYYHGTKFDKVTKENLINGVKKKNDTLVDGRPQKLQLFNVTHSDEGWYTCVAFNAADRGYASAYLKVVNELLENSISYATLFETIGLVILIVCFILIILFSVIDIH